MSEQELNRLASQIANEALSKLREQRLDCTDKGGYHDCSQEIHTAILHSAKNQIKKQKSF